LKEIEQKLGPFVRRVRLLQAWMGLAIGACAGGLVSLAWAVMDWTRFAYADWRGLGAVVLLASVAGAVVGLFRKVAPADLAASIDKRARLKDRLATAVETRPSTVFDQAQVLDADRALEGLVPARIYPVRFGKWQIAALTAIVLAASVFLLGNSPGIRGPKTPGERAELKEIGQQVQRVAKPLEKPVKALEVPASQKKLAGDMNKFAKELEEGKLNKEEALRKANDLASKAEDEAKSQAKVTERQAGEAETALGKYEKLQLDEAGIKSEDLQKLNLNPDEQAALDKVMKDQGFDNPKSKFSDKELSEMGASRTAEKLAQLSPDQRESLRNSIAKQQEQLQKEIDRIDKLPEKERKALEQQRAELQKQMQEMQKLSEAMKLSEDALKELRKLMDSDEMKKLRETISQMQQKAQQAGQQGKPLTKEEMEQLKQQMEELAKAMKDSKFKEEMMQRIKEMQKQLESGQMSAEAAQQLMQAFGQMGDGGSQDPNGTPSTGSDDNFADTGKVVKSDKEMQTKGSTTATRVTGAWNDKQGEQWSVTVKAPTQLGNRSSVPYQSVMPKYRKAAEKALSSGKIPKDQEKRVKEYFDSLNGGK